LTSEAELKKAKAEGKRCHDKIMKSKKKPIELFIPKTPHVTLRQNTRRKNEGRN